MTIWINGEERAVEDTAAPNIAALVLLLELPAPAVLIEHNGLALLRGEWIATPLHDGDRLEVMRIAAGG